MQRIVIVFWTLCLGLAALWFVADPVTAAHPFAQTQNSLVNLTGIVAMGAMAVSLLLALRSVAVEPYVGGLDKSYRLHKWLGIAALVMVIGHWLFVNAPVKREGGARVPAAGPSLLHTLQGPARGVGSWCFYAAVILLVLALVKWFPYRQFIRTHRLLAVVYLFLVFHSVVLLKTAYWSHAIAYAIAALMTAGAAAAVYILFKRVGRTRQAVGAIESVSTHQDGRIVAATVCLKDRWPGHEAGQFAFVKFNDGEAPHPFTIASGWKNDGLLTFVIKGLGDYTSALASALKTGSLVTVEGPYGQFNFNGPHARQIWISAGIGITPFIARMQQLAEQPDGKTIDLFHATGSPDVRVNDSLWRIAAASRVKLHVFVGGQDSRLTADHICNGVPDWKSADIWFCGPVEFGKDLRNVFVSAGLAPTAFHQELFHLR